MMRGPALAALLVAAVVLAGCSSDEESSPPADTSSGLTTVPPSIVPLTTTTTIEGTPVSDAEIYAQVGLTPSQREALTGMLSHEFDRLMAGEADELSALTTQRDKLEAEQMKLMQAHYADAIPLAVLKKEQARIGAELDHLNARLDRHHGEYADAKAVLTRCLDLLDNLADLYARCDDVTRRLCNQALFTKVYVEDEGTLRAEHARPFGLLLDPQVQASALTWAKTAKQTGQRCREAQTLADSSSAEGLSLAHVATLTRLELATSAVTGRRANQLRYRAWLLLAKRVEL